MASITSLPNPEAQEKLQSIKSVTWFLNHLDLKDVKIVEELAKGLAKAHSKSYQEWLNK